MNISQTTGITASIFTASGLIPQLIKLIREKKARDISIGMLWIMIIGLFLWICYGFFQNDFIIIAANGASLLVYTATLALVLKYKIKIEPTPK